MLSYQPSSMKASFAPRLREMTKEEQMDGHFHLWIPRAASAGLAGVVLMACAAMPSQTAWGGVIIEDESCAGPGGSCGIITVNSTTNTVSMTASHDDTSSNAITLFDWLRAGCLQLQKTDPPLSPL